MGASPRESTVWKVERSARSIQWISLTAPACWAIQQIFVPSGLKASEENTVSGCEKTSRTGSLPSLPESQMPWRCPSSTMKPSASPLG